MLSVQQKFIMFNSKKSYFWEWVVKAVSYSKVCLEEVFLRGDSTNHYTFYPFLGCIKNL